jgi:hypothetical protein
MDAAALDARRRCRSIEERNPGRAGDDVVFVLAPRRRFRSVGDISHNVLLRRVEFVAEDVTVSSEYRTKEFHDLARRAIGDAVKLGDGRA